MPQLHFIHFVILLISSVFGQVPSDVVAHLCGAPLFTLKKKSGGLRPIAVGEVLHRLSSKCISKSVFLKHLNYYLPFTLVYGCLLVVNPLFIQLAASKVIMRFLLTTSGFFKLIFQMLLIQLICNVMFEEICSQILSMVAWKGCCYGS